jgi:hypothetical protein
MKRAAVWIAVGLLAVAAMATVSWTSAARIRFTDESGKPLSGAYLRFHYDGHLVNPVHPVSYVARGSAIVRADGRVTIPGRLHVRSLLSLSMPPRPTDRTRAPASPAVGIGTRSATVGGTNQRAAGSRAALGSVSAADLAEQSGGDRRARQVDRVDARVSINGRAHLVDAHGGPPRHRCWLVVEGPCRAFTDVISYRDAVGALLGPRRNCRTNITVA